MIKILEDKIKENKLQTQQKNVWDVKDYKVERQTDEEELKLFHKYELQQELENIIGRLQSDPYCTVSHIFKNIGDATKAWENFHNRKFFYCKDQETIENVSLLNGEEVLGIDVEYFYQEGVIVISTLQISSPETDLLIDCLSSDLSLKRISSFLKPLFHNPKILKLMHGADNDLVLLKSNFNLSVVNFLDTARLDLELIKKNNLRGLGTICNEYTGIKMPKQHQVS